MIREPAVAGLFYPGNRQELIWWLKERLSAPPHRIYPAVGIMVPHAGYIYSGDVAAEVYRQIPPPDVAVLMGPNHTGLGPEISLMPQGEWLTPLGRVPIEEDLAREILAEAPFVEPDHLAHLREHSLEVQLPFLQFINPHIKIVPIVLFPTTFTKVVSLAGALASVIGRRSENILLVASSDMSHYLPSSLARQKDFLAIEKILAMDAEGLMRVVLENDISMCGYIPTAVMIEASKLLGAKKATLVSYSHSGKVTGEEPVVGYAGIIVHR